MKLILYRHPFIDDTAPGRVRILFEAETVSGPGEGKPRDCYCYVWVANEGVVSGFQVIIDHEYIIEYRPSREVLFGMIGKLTLGRSISRLDNPVRRSWMKAAVETMESDAFSALAAGMERIVRTERAEPLRLTEKERRLLARLIRRSRDN